MSIQKQSLFKQKLRQKKLNEQNENEIKKGDNTVLTFPKVFKLQNVQKEQNNLSFNSSIIEAQNKELNFRGQVLKQDNESSYLQENKEQLEKVLSTQQLTKINNENWQMVDSMNEQQRRKYILQIQSSLPQHFLQKLKKKKNISELKYEPIKANPLTISQANSNQTHQMLQKQKKQPIPQLQTKSKSQQQSQQNAQNHKQVMDHIYLNLKTQKLQYISEQLLSTLSIQKRNQLINKMQIFQHLKSQNNQSQIIGAKLTLSWFKNIFPSQNTVFFIENIPFHSKIMLSYLKKLLIVIEENLVNTKFESCYIQMIVNCVEILTIVYKNLSLIQLVQQFNFVEKQYKKSQSKLKSLVCSKLASQSEDKEMTQMKIKQQQMFYESLGVLSEQLKREIQNRQEEKQQEAKEKLERMTRKLDDMMEGMLIEQTLRREEFEQFGINPAINQFLEPLIRYWNSQISYEANSKNKNKSSPQHSNQEGIKAPSSQKLFPNQLLIPSLHQFYTPLYNLITKFNHKLRCNPFYKHIIHSIYQALFTFLEPHYFHQPLQSLLSPQSLAQHRISPHYSILSILIFKILFIYRQLTQNTDKLACFIQSHKLSWSLDINLLHPIVYVNFDHYLHLQDLSNQDIQIIQKMLAWLKNLLNEYYDLPQQKRISIQEILISILNLFLSTDQQIYSLIAQHLLNQVIGKTIQLYEQNFIKKCKLGTFLLKQQEIKKIIQNYNFNSFGNDIFTKIIFWIAVIFDQNYQSLIAEEVMMRYPMLFYYASEPNNKQTKQNNQTNLKLTNQSKISFSLHGNVSHYYKINQGKQNQWFTHDSNRETKANLIRILWMNLDFSNFQESFLKTILSQQLKKNTQAFNFQKPKLNTNNYFFKYLFQPFMPKIYKYKQLF